MWFCHCQIWERQGGKSVFHSGQSVRCSSFVPKLLRLHRLAEVGTAEPSPLVAVLSAVKSVKSSVKCCILRVTVHGFRVLVREQLVSL